MTTIPICQDLELLMAPFLNSQLTLTHQLEWDCKCPHFWEEQFISCLKIPNPFLIENQKVRAKICCGFQVKGSGQGQVPVICTCLRMETHLSLQTRFVQNTFVSQNDVSNNIEWQTGQLYMLSTWEILVYHVYLYVHIHSYSGLRVWCCHIKHNVIIGCFTKQKSDR